MFIACSTRTMANARAIVQDNDAIRRIPPRRARLIDMTRRWHEQQARKAPQAPSTTLAQQIEEQRRKHRRTRPYVAGEHGASPRELVSMIAAWHGLIPDDIFGLSRRHPVIEARFDAIVAVYDLCKIDGRKYSLTEMGRLFKRDHTSILSAFRKRGVR